MGGGPSAQEPPPKSWETGAWVGLFCDPYADGVVSAGEIAGCINQLRELLQTVSANDGQRLTLWAEKQRGLLANLLDALAASGKKATFAAKELKDAAALEALVDAWCKDLRELQPGGYAFVPCGWKDGLGCDNHCVLVVEAVEAANSEAPSGQAPAASEAPAALMRITFVNAGEGGDYHPGSVDRHPKMRRQTALHLGDVRLDRIMDPAFLANLLTQRKDHECHKVEVTYDVLLPWLVNKPTISEQVARNGEDTASDWRTPARTKTSGWKSLWEACGYILRRKGVSRDMLKQLALRLRQAMLVEAQGELQTLLDPNAARSPEKVQALLGSIPLLPSRGTAFEGAKVIGLYFSAHWCPPCRAFTPQLCEVYNKLRARGETGFEVVFVSGDKDQAAFDEYFSEMPWLAVPFGDPSISALNKMFEVEGIPTLVFLSPDGRVLRSDGRAAVSNDPTGEHFPWPAAPPGDGDAKDAEEPGSITPSDRTLIAFGCRQLARSALKAFSTGFLTSDELAGLEAEIAETDRLADQLVARSGLEHAELPGTLSPQLAAAAQPLGAFELLRTTGEDEFRGQRVTPSPPPLANMLDLPARADITNLASATDALERAMRITGTLLSRARDTGGGAGATSASRLAIQGQVISLVQALFTEVLPVPLPPGESAAGVCVWSAEPVTKEAQLKACDLIYKLLHRLGEMWQDIEDPTRPSECARAVAAACGYAMFDAVIRQQASDAPMEISIMLNEGDGVALSTGVGRKRGLELERASEWLELLTPALCHARAAAVAYFAGLKRVCKDAIFDLPIHLGGEMGLVIELEKYGPTVVFLLALLDRCQYPIIPEGRRPRTEMDSIMMWFGSHQEQETAHVKLARERPEWVLMRNTAVLFKFLYSMLPMVKENMTVRKERVAMRGQLPLTFSPGTGRSAGRLEGLKALYWQTQTVRGSHHHIADLVVHSFYQRKLTWGEGMTLRSPADPGRLLERQRPTEEDILHTEASQLRKARFDGTLSAEEAESLLTSLVAPYVRVPLAAHFFADLQRDPLANDALRCGNRASFLFNEQLQALFRAVVLEQGTWVPEDSAGLVVRVPMRRTTKQQEEYRQLLNSDARLTKESATLGTPSGLLLNELRCSPEGVLRPLIELLRYTQEVSSCSLHSASAAFVLYIISVAASVELFALQVKSAPGGAAPDLDSLLAELGGLLRGPVLGIVDRWIEEAQDEVSSDGKRRGNIPTLAVLHAYKALLWASPVASGAVDAGSVVQLLGSLAYVRGHHCYGQQLRNAELTAEEHADPDLLEKKLVRQLGLFLQSQGFDEASLEPGSLKQFVTGQPVWFVHEGLCLRVPLAGLSERSQGFAAPPAEVPEMALAEVIQLVRKPLVAHLEALPEDDLSQTLADVVRAALGSAHSVPASGWQRTEGHPGLYAAPAAGVLVDAQGGEIMYQGAELRPVPDSMASFADFELVFGREALQCAMRYTHEHRRWVDIIGEAHELMEWDAPAIDEQGVGAPGPLPSKVFADPAEEGPPMDELRAVLEGITLVGHDGITVESKEALSGAKVLGIYFSGHWCPPCRGFTPKLAATYNALLDSHPGEFEVIFVSSDRSEEQFTGYFGEMPWRYAIPYADGAIRQRLGELFKVQGIPTLCLVTPAGHTVAMDGRGKVAEDASGANFPWGSLEPAEPGAAEEKEDAVTYCGVRYNRPFVWYHPGKVFPAPPPEPEPSEAWGVKLLQPCLEALFPTNPPDKKMDYVLYMPEEVLPEGSEEMVLLGMADEQKPFATWKEVRLHRQWSAVHCFNLVSHGRRVYRTLVWSSHAARCLETLDPMHLKPSCCPVPPAILDASGDWRRKRLPDPSLVIVRDSPELGGRETLLPARLLAGVVPGALLGAHSFWQGEDLTIRGYPQSAKDEWFPYALELRLLPSGRAEVVRRDPKRLSRLGARPDAIPEEPLQIRREASASAPAARPPALRREASGAAPAAALAEAPQQSEEEALPAAPVLTRNVSAASRLAPLLEMGFPEDRACAALDAARGADGREDYDLALTFLMDEPPPPPRPPPTLSAMDRAISATGGVAAGGAKEALRLPTDASLGDLVLLDLLRAPSSSPLHRLASALARLEDLGHILVWGGALGPNAEHRIAMIELPRLKLRFQPRQRADGSVRVCSLDHDGWYLAEIDLAEARGEGAGLRTALLAELLAGVPHSLLLEKDTRELQLLVPAWELRRPKVKGAPFGTHLIFHRGAEAWTEVFSNSRCFLYPVHPSRAFLQPRSLDALLYLVLLRFYARQYEAAHRLAMSIAVDVPFAPTELWGFRQLFLAKDGHPDANALRLRLMVAVRFSEDVDALSDARGGWEVDQEMDAYLKKLPHVTAGCMLTPREELQACKLCKEMTPAVRLHKAFLETVVAGQPQVSLAAERPFLGGEPWNKLICTSKELFEAQEWPSRFKYKCPAEEGGYVLSGPEALNPIFEDLLIDDDMGGSTRQLGFIYLYMLATGQLKLRATEQGVECQASMADILARMLQLKLAHWGKAMTGTEVEPKPSKLAYVLALAMDHPEAGWPRVPVAGGDLPVPAGEPHVLACTSDEVAQCTELLANGVDCAGHIDFDEEEDGEGDGPAHGQMAMNTFHVDLKAAAARALLIKQCEVNRLARLHLLKTRLAAIESSFCSPQRIPAPVSRPECLGPFVPSNFSCEEFVFEPFKLGTSTEATALLESANLSLTSQDLGRFGHMPLGQLAQEFLIITDTTAQSGAEAKLPFNVAAHTAAESPIAVDMLKRLEQDLNAYEQRRVRDVCLKTLSRSDQEAICQGSAPAIQASLKCLAALEAALEHMYETGMHFVEHAVSLAKAWAVHVADGAAESDGGPLPPGLVARAFEASSAAAAAPPVCADAQGLAGCQLRLRQRGGQVLRLGYNELAVASLSTQGHEDLRRCNPHLHAPSDLLLLVATTELHATRLAQAARASAAATSLKKQLAIIQQTGNAVPTAQAARLRHSVIALAEQLGAQRFFLELGSEDASGKLDPRMLVFEFLSSFLLRERQVEMVRDLRSRALQGLSSCQQMIMGAGKTTVVGPMLALCLADGETLVMQTMPSALLEMSRNVLREVFGNPLSKRIFTLSFDRTQDDVAPVYAIAEKLELARKHHGMVVASPESVKSLMLKMVEMLHSLEEHGAVRRADAIKSADGRGARERLDAVREMARRSELADAVASVLAMWRGGVVIMDEVDVLLHPLKSELNFPIGEKTPIDLSGERWELPIHLLSLLFCDDLDVSLQREDELTAAEWREAEERAGEPRSAVAKACREVIDAGIANFSFQTIPHLVLMDPEFYEEKMAIIMARYCLIWLHRFCHNNLTESIANGALLGYLVGKSKLEAQVVAALRPETMKMINLSADWVQSFVPHCLSRIDRVAYGLLSASDKQPASAPASRRLMAVPFLAKDVPSRNSEFAHPDVLIGLTLLAYRLEGLRHEDLHRIAKQLRSDFARQSGQKSNRPASVLFEKWKREGREAWSRQVGDGAPPSVLNIELFQPEDPQQMASLVKLLRVLPQVVHHYLSAMVFPDTMNFQRMKVSAAGHELGADMLFSRRVGFSGTPSNLLPVDLAPCVYEPGSDGKIIKVLTDPAVVGALDVPAGWDARSLLAQVASAEPPYHTFIDTGALITGLENVEVAELLLRELPAWFEGVVYLDRSDRQMVLLRASGRACPLQQCGLPWDRRFSFYDQIHTTGMDIKQAPHVRAALTIGKDMVFRDYAQGAWRMRGIGAGQTMDLIIIPEVKNRIRQDLSLVPGLFHEDRWEMNVPPWLLINSMRSEGLQSVQLNLQELHNVFRKRALQAFATDEAVGRAAGLDHEGRAARFGGDGQTAPGLFAAVNVFRERISHDLSTEVAEPKTFMEVVGGHLDEYEKMGASAHLGITAADQERVQLVKDRAFGSAAETKAVRGGLDSTRQQQQEREQQQQQMKEREQEEEQMSQFRRDDEQPLPWLAPVLTRSPALGRIEASVMEATGAGHEFPFSALVVGDEAFYPLALFHSSKTQPRLPFPRQILLSSNYFRPGWAGLGDRRLKNIPLVLDWRPADGERYLLVPSVAEAETVRRLVHTGEYGVYGQQSGQALERKPLEAPLAVRTLAGHRLDATPSFRALDAGGGAPDEELLAQLMCLRFFHGEMFFTDSELALVMRSLAAAPMQDRRLFFEESLRCRRRERKEWSDTPVARAFVAEAEWDTLRPKALVEQARANIIATLSYVEKKSKELAKLQEVAMAALASGNEAQAQENQGKLLELERELGPYPSDLQEAFKRFDVDRDGALSRNELATFLKASGAQAAAGDMLGVMQLVKKDLGEGATDTFSTISFDEFSAAFGPSIQDIKVDEPCLDGLVPWMCDNPRCPASGSPELLNMAEAVMCIYCGEQPRPDLRGVLGQAGPPQGQWSCGVCTFFNGEAEAFCAMCNTARSAVGGGDDFE